MRIAVTILWLVSGVAATATADDWTDGSRAFEEGRFEAALRHFESARDAGLAGPAVHYNIGVSQYRLGRYAEARDTFATIAGRFPKMRPLAEYNLGLVEEQLGDRNAARLHYLTSYRLGRDDRILRILASRQLRDLTPENPGASPWSGTLGARFGYDDNIALLDESGLATGVTTESPMIDLFGSFSGPWTGRNGLRVEGSAYLIRYGDAEDFDQSRIAGSVLYEWRPLGWRFQVGLQASTGTIGGDAFDRKLGAMARAVRYVGANSAFDVRYSYEDVSEAEAVFAGLQGSREQLDARYRWRRNAHRVQIRYWREFNDRLDPGVSPDRDRIGAEYDFQPQTGLGFAAGFSLRNSKYNDIVLQRDEELRSIRGALTYSLPNNWLLLLEYRDARNDASDPAFSYDRATMTLGIQRIF